MLLDFIIRALTPRISPMVYIMMFTSMIVGFCFLTGFLVAPGESILYASNFWIDNWVWGLILLCSATVAEIGLWMKKRPLIGLGSMGAFLMWSFASLGLLFGGHYYVLIIFGLFHLIFQGYVYLANSLDVLERVAIQHNRGLRDEHNKHRFSKKIRQLWSDKNFFEDEKHNKRS